MSVQDALVYFRHFSSYDSSNRIKQCPVSTRGSKSEENNNPTGVKMPQRCTKKKIKLGFPRCNFWTLCWLFSYCIIHAFVLKCWCCWQSHVKLSKHLWSGVHSVHKPVKENNQHYQTGCCLSCSSHYDVWLIVFHKQQTSMTRTNFQLGN